MRKTFAYLALTAIVTVAALPLAASDYRSEALKRLETIEKKTVGLAEAVPDGKYTWRPAEDVRSVSEVFLHVAAANYGIPGSYGTPPPEGFSFGSYDKQTTKKAEILPKLKASFAHLRMAIEKLSVADAEKAVKMFGQDTTNRGAVLFTLEHLSEHMGQAIAYARTNGVVPPWSVKE